MSKSELGRSPFGVENDPHQGGEPQAVSRGETAETKKETPPAPGMMLVMQAAEARNNLCKGSAAGPAERQLVFAANREYWANMREQFEKDKSKRQEEEIAGGVVNTDPRSAFLADSLDDIAIGFCEEAEALWDGQAEDDAKTGDYSLDYYHQAKEADYNLAATATANQYAQDYLYGNLDLGPDSIWGNLLPSPGESDLRDLYQGLSDKLQANEELRKDFRSLANQIPSPDHWKSFRGFTKGLLKSLSRAYDQARDCYGEMIREEDQEIEVTPIGRAALAAATS